MSLKSYLQALINALLKKSNENASPKESASSNVQITTSGQQVVSPIDGWANLSVQNATGSNSNVRIMTNGGFSHQHLVQAKNYSTQMHIPVRKGDTVTVDVSGFSSYAWLNFYSRLGGGLTRLFKAEVTYAFA